LKATDPDPLDRLEFQLLDGAPDGAQIQTRDDGTAELRWTPRENGDFKLHLQVQDDGLPRRSHDVTIPVRVSDPPAVSPEQAARAGGFDHTRQTVLCGVLEMGNKRQAWFEVRTRGELLKIGEGEALRVDSFEAKVALIADDFVEMVAGERRLRLRVGQSLDLATAVDASLLQADSRSPTATEN
jgi:hypothetical protein